MRPDPMKSERPARQFDALLLEGEPPFTIERATGARGQYKPHRCDLPGAWRRWRLGLAEGSVIRCNECRTRWEFCRGMTPRTYNVIRWRKAGPDTRPKVRV